MNLLQAIRRIAKKLSEWYALSRHDAYSIADHFRKQGAQIGQDSFIAVKRLGGEPFLVKIGDHVGISGGVQFITHGLGWNFRERIPDIQVFGKIVIEDNCNIGTNAIILPNVTIGRNSMVAAGAVVTKDVPPNSIIGGNPAKVIGNTEEYFAKLKEIWKEQKPKAYLPELEEAKYYSPRYFASLRGKPENRAMLRKHLEELFWGKAVYD